MKLKEIKLISPSELARTFFFLELPISMDDLKKAFRREARKHHSDTKGHEASEQEKREADERFILIKAVYDHLITTADFMTQTIDREIEIGGVALSQFGLGLGPRKNGRDCDACNHKGYLVHERPFLKRCVLCDGEGWGYFKVCRSCAGTGKFTQKHSRKIVDCLTCSGHGVISNRHVGMCPKCRGVGFSSDTSRPPQRAYSKCYTCNGTGEIEVWNPVLPKWRL